MKNLHALFSPEYNMDKEKLGAWDAEMIENDIIHNNTQLKHGNCVYKTNSYTVEIEYDCINKVVRFLHISKTGEN